MSIKKLMAACAATLLIVAACSSASGTPSAGGASPGGSTPPAAAACRESADAGAVAVSIKDFSFEPGAITAKVGQVIAFTDTGSAPHNATLDAGGCATRTLQSGQSDGLVFATAGSYPFHCSVHPQMKGTITVGA